MGARVARRWFVALVALEAAWLSFLAWLAFR